jgi:hypothetical protein
MEEVIKKKLQESIAIMDRLIERKTFLEGEKNNVDKKVKNAKIEKVLKKKAEAERLARRLGREKAKAERLAGEKAEAERVAKEKAEEVDQDDTNKLIGSIPSGELSTPIFKTAKQHFKDEYLPKAFKSTNSFERAVCLANNQWKTLMTYPEHFKRYKELEKKSKLDFEKYYRDLTFPKKTTQYDRELPLPPCKKVKVSN